jgi:hypothetical protein
MPKIPQVERRKISDLTPDPSNANAGTERGLSMLDDSLSAVGLGRSIVADKHGMIIGGNKTTERAVDNGFEDAIVVHTTGKELVVVQRDDLDLSDGDPNNPARRLAFFDNRVGQLDLSWSAEQLLADVNAGFDFEHLFSENELNNLLRANEPFDPNAEWQGMPEFEQEDKLGAYQIIVHFEDEKSLKAFAELTQQSITVKTKYIWYPAQENLDARNLLTVDES